MDEKGFKTKNTFRMEGLLVDYDFPYHATEGDDGGHVCNITKKFQKPDGVIEDPKQFAKPLEQT